MTSEPFDVLPPDEPRQLSPSEIAHRKNTGGDLDAFIPFETAAPRGPQPQAAPATLLGVPFCASCGYAHRDDEQCQREPGPAARFLEGRRR